MKNNHQKSAWKSWTLVITAIAVITAIVFIFGYAWHEHKKYSNEHITRTQEQLLTIAKTTAKSLEGFIEEHIETLKFLSLNPLFQEAVHNKIVHDETDSKYCPTKISYEIHKGDVDALTVLDDKGIILHRHPFIKDRPGMDLTDKPRVAEVLREPKSYVSNLFINNLGNPAISISEPVFWEDKFAGFVRCMVEARTIYRRLIQHIKIGDKGYMLLLDADRAFFYHPEHKFIRGEIEDFKKEKIAGEEEREREVIKKILAGSEGYDTFVFDEFSDTLSCFAWTYVTTNPVASGTSEIKIKNQITVPKDLLIKKARIIAEEIDKKIPKIENLLNIVNLRNILKDMQEKYPDIIEINIHGPRSAEDSTLLYKVSTNPNLEGKPSAPEDVPAVQEQIRHNPEKNIIDVTAPIHTSEMIWPVIVVQPYSEIAGLIRKHAANTFAFVGFIILIIGSGTFIFYKTEKKKAVLETEAKFLKEIADSTEALKLTHSELNQIFNAAVPLCVITKDYVMHRVNETFCSYFGMEKNEILGRKCYEIWQGPVCNTQECPMRRISSGMAKSEYEVDKEFNDGRRVSCIITTIPYLGPEGELLGLVENITDITLMKKTMKERDELQTQLQQAQKIESIGTLAGGIAHDFNNILFPIIGYTEMAMDEMDEESDARKDLEEALKAAKRAKELVQQIMAFGRRQSGDLKPLKIQFVIKEALKLLRASIPTTIEISQSIDNGCGPVMSDPSQIHQILMNLCINAYHAMEEKGGKLKVTLVDIHLDSESISRYPDFNPGDYVKLTVSDTGHGMEKSVKDRVFEPYFTTKGIGKGTGMGLAVVHGIIMKNGGHITIDSEPGKGTAFHVYLPSINTIEEPESVSNGLLQGGHERILLVDDKDVNIRMVQQILKSIGYHVTARNSSIDALEAFRAQPEKFNLVITDMTMPNMTGDQLSRELIKIRADIPVILLSGFSEVMTEQKAKEAGIREYIMKPIIKSDLAKIIRKVLD